MQAFGAFPRDNYPHGEHDLGAAEHAGVRYFWKIDCYDPAKQFGSPDAADPAVTVRVLTISEGPEQAARAGAPAFFPGLDVITTASLVGPATFS